MTCVSVRRVAEATKERLRDEDGKYRREHVRAVAQRVEVISPNEMRIMGNRTDLLRTLAASAGEQSAVLGVRILKPKWRTRHDSNV